MGRNTTNAYRRTCEWTDVRFVYKTSTSPCINENTGTPAQIARSPEDAGMLSFDDNRSRRKNTPGDQSMRRTIQDLVASVDPNVKIEPEVEDVCFSK